MRERTLLQFTVFLAFLTGGMANAHALVVAPLVAVGIVKVLAVTLGLLAGPLAFAVKILTKAKWAKTLVITMVILLLLAGMLYCGYFVIGMFRLF